MAAKSHLKQSLVPQLVETSNYTPGYNDKLLPDELPNGSATSGSYNFILDVDGKWTTRSGSSYLGTQSTDTGGCTSSAKLLRRDGVEIPMVFYGTKSKIFHPDSLDWMVLETGLTSGLTFGKAMGEKTTDNVNKLIFCNGTDNYRVWNGATGSVNTFTATTITLKNVTSLFNAGFDPVGKLSDAGTVYSYGGITQAAWVAATTTTTVVIQSNLTLAALGFSASGTFSWNGVTFTYTSIANQTFSGVTPDPTQGSAPTVANVGAATITITGTATLASLSYLATGSVIIQDKAYAYTSIANQTFSGVTPDPTLTTNNVQPGQLIAPTKMAVGDFIVQSGGGNTFISVTPDPTLNGMVANDPIASLPVPYPTLPLGNVMASLAGRVVMFVKPDSALYGGGSLIGSKLNVYDNFTFSASRVASEGFQLMMSEGGGNGMALVQFEGKLAAFKNNAVSQVAVTLDANDFPTLAPLLPYDETLSGHVGCVGPKAAFALRNQVFFVSPRKIINTLQRVSQVDYPQSLPFSDKIQKTVDSMTWDSATCGTGFNYLARFSGKSASTDKSPDKQLVYDQRFDAWWTPLLGQSISSYFVYGGSLCGTLTDSPDVIKLDVGTNDYATATTNGIPITSNLVLERQNFGRKSSRKKSQRLYVEGWMSQAGTATFTLTFDEGASSVSGTLKGNENGYFFEGNILGAFGDEGFGVDTFGGTWITNTSLPAGVGHFRILFTFNAPSYWNVQPSISTNNYFKLINHSWEVLMSRAAVPGTQKKAMI